MVVVSADRKKPAGRSSRRASTIPLGILRNHYSSFLRMGASCAALATGVVTEAEVQSSRLALHSILMLCVELLHYLAVCFGPGSLKCSRLNTSARSVERSRGGT